MNDDERENEMENYRKYFSPLEVNPIELQTIEERQLIHGFDKRTFEIDVKNLQARKSVNEIR